MGNMSKNMFQLQTVSLPPVCPLACGGDQSGYTLLKIHPSSQSEINRI